MDFVLRLPKAIHGHDSIFMVVDRFSKIAHIIPCMSTMNAFKIASLFLKVVARLHGVSRSIVFDRDIKFMSYFWKTLWNLMVPSYSTPVLITRSPMARQCWTNRSLENMLHWLVGSHVTYWDNVLPTMDFSYNGFVNHSTRRLLLKVVLGMNPWHPIDFISITYLREVQSGNKNFRQTYVWCLWES